jgi:hypothetical protein
MTDELLIIHNVDIQDGTVSVRKKYGDYCQDFRYYRSPDPAGSEGASEVIEIYRPIPNARAHSRMQSLKEEKLN